LEYVVPVLIVIVVGFGLLRAQRRGKAARRPAAPAVAAGPAVVAPGEPPEPVATPATAAPEPPSLDAQLSQLEKVYETVAASAAHPRELAENAEFQRAVGLLADPEVELEMVVQYVRGTNWALTCAALAALAQRFNGEMAADQVLGQFHRLVPWAMYFALAYLVELHPRPPVGAPVVSAQSWWTNVPLLQLIFRDYFVPRLFCPPRDLWGRRRVRRGALSADRLAHPAHQGFPRERRSSARDRAREQARFE
jgi:hypothetical protein